MQPVGENQSGVDATYRVGSGFWSHVAGLLVREQETVQLGPGTGKFFARQALGRDLTMFQSRVSPKLVGHVVIDPAWVVFMLPLGWRGDYLFNGIAARPNDVFMACGPSGYTTVGEARDTLAIGIRQSRLAHFMRALAGGAEVPAPKAPFRVLETPRSSALRRRAVAAMISALSKPLDEGRFNLSRTVENDFISFLSAVLLSQPEWCARRDPGRFQPFQIVRAAERAYDAQQGKNVSLAELCAATGVGQTWLSRCFREVYGESPVAYLRARRLSEARARLLDQSNPPASVKDVALSLGFTHLGRFAAEYRARFEEKPSESLLRTARN